MKEVRINPKGGVVTLEINSNFAPCVMEWVIVTRDIVRQKARRLDEYGVPGDKNNLNTWTLETSPQELIDGQGVYFATVVCENVDIAKTKFPERIFPKAKNREFNLSYKLMQDGRPVQGGEFDFDESFVPNANHGFMDAVIFELNFKQE